MTCLNARSKAFGDSLASTSRAISTNRLWRSISVSLGLAGFFFMVTLLSQFFVPSRIVFAYPANIKASDSVFGDVVRLSDPQDESGLVPIPPNVRVPNGTVDNIVAVVALLARVDKLSCPAWRDTIFVAEPLTYWPRCREFFHELLKDSKPNIVSCDERGGLAVILDIKSERLPSVAFLEITPAREVSTLHFSAVPQLDVGNASQHYREKHDDECGDSLNRPVVGVQYLTSAPDENLKPAGDRAVRYLAMIALLGIGVVLLVVGITLLIAGGDRQ